MCGRNPVRAASGADGGGKSDPEEPADHTLGHSQGSFSAKIHVLSDGHRHPLYFRLTPGQTHESTVLEALLDDVDQSSVDQDGNEVAGLCAFSEDKECHAGWIDESISRGLGVEPIIPSEDNRAARSVEFDCEGYRELNFVERLIGWSNEG